MQLHGANYMVYGWGQQISALNGRLIAFHPAEQRKLDRPVACQGNREPFV